MLYTSSRSKIKKKASSKPSLFEVLDVKYKDLFQLSMCGQLPYTQKRKYWQLPILGYDCRLDYEAIRSSNVRDPHAEIQNLNFSIIAQAEGDTGSCEELGGMGCEECQDNVESNLKVFNKAHQDMKGFLHQCVAKSNDVVTWYENEFSIIALMKDSFSATILDFGEEYYVCHFALESSKHMINDDTVEDFGKYLTEASEKGEWTKFLGRGSRDPLAVEKVKVFLGKVMTGNKEHASILTTARLADSSSSMMGSMLTMMEDGGNVTMHCSRCWLPVLHDLRNCT